MGQKNSINKINTDSNNIIPSELLDLTNKNINISNLYSLLYKNNIIKNIYLSWNNISNNGCKALYNSCIYNYKLRVLDISSNNIHDLGAYEIAKLIKVNSSIEEINLFNNFITDNGANAILNSLSSNSVLVWINLESNYVSNGVMHLISMISLRDNVLKKYDLPFDCTVTNIDSNFTNLIITDDHFTNIANDRMVIYDENDLNDKVLEQLTNEEAYARFKNEVSTIVESKFPVLNSETVDTPTTIDITDIPKIINDPSKLSSPTYSNYNILKLPEELKESDEVIHKIWYHLNSLKMFRIFMKSSSSFRKEKLSAEDYYEYLKSAITAEIIQELIVYWLPVNKLLSKQLAKLHYGLAYVEEVENDVDKINSAREQLVQDLSTDNLLEIIKSHLPSDVPIEIVRDLSRQFRKTGKARLYIGRLYEIFGDDVGVLIPYIGKALDDHELNARLEDAYAELLQTIKSEEVLNSIRSSVPPNLEEEANISESVDLLKVVDDNIVHHKLSVDIENNIYLNSLSTEITSKLTSIIPSPLLTSPITSPKLSPILSKLSPISSPVLAASNINSDHVLLNVNSKTNLNNIEELKHIPTELSPDLVPELLVKPTFVAESTSVASSDLCIDVLKPLLTLPSSPSLISKPFPNLNASIISNSNEVVEKVKVLASPRELIRSPRNLATSSPHRISRKLSLRSNDINEPPLLNTKISRVNSICDIPNQRSSLLDNDWFSSVLTQAEVYISNKPSESIRYTFPISVIEEDDDVFSEDDSDEINVPVSSNLQDDTALKEKVKQQEELQRKEALLTQKEESKNLREEHRNAKLKQNSDTKPKEMVKPVETTSESKSKIEELKQKLFKNTIVEPSVISKPDIKPISKNPISEKDELLMRQAERLFELQEREEKEQLEQKQRHKIQNNVKSSINKWLSQSKSNPNDTKPATLNNLLYNLPSIFPISNLPKFEKSKSRDECKKYYMKTLLYIHPDRLSNVCDIKIKILAENIFCILRDAFNIMMSKQ